MNPGPVQVDPTNPGNRQTTPTTPNPYTNQSNNFQPAVNQQANNQAGRVATINNTQYELEYFYYGSDGKFYPGDQNGNFQDGTGRWCHSTDAYYLASDGNYYPHNAWANQGASGSGVQSSLNSSAQSYPNASGYRGH